MGHAFSPTRFACPDALNRNTRKEREKLINRLLGSSACHFHEDHRDLLPGGGQSPSIFVVIDKLSAIVGTRIAGSLSIASLFISTTKSVKSVIWLITASIVNT